MRYLLNFCLLLLTLSAAAVNHNPILPKLQKLHYGPSQFVLNGISIGFTGTPSSEYLCLMINQYPAHLASSFKAHPVEIQSGRVFHALPGDHVTAC